MKAAMIGDNCIDYYLKYTDNDGKTYENVKYITGNIVDTGVNLRKLGIDVSIISTTGNDGYGKLIKDTLIAEDLDISHLKTGDGSTAITYMSLIKNDRVHGEYSEGVLENIEFDEADINFAASHDLVHTALWGHADGVLSLIKEKRNTLISFDYADELESPIIDKTIISVDYGFFSYHKKRDQYIENYLIDKVNRGMKISVATFGEYGSLAYDGTSFIECPIIPVKTVINTVGAGDSYIAGFLAGVLKKQDTFTCMQMGASIAAQVVQVFNPWQ